MPVPEQPLVSVVVPSFNHARFVVEAVESALSQTYAQVEVVIVDDGSTDGSGELLERRYGANRRVTLIRRENRGAHVTINEGIVRSRGELIAILNSDDSYEPTRIARLVALAPSSPDSLFFAFTAVNVVDEQGEAGKPSGPLTYYDSLLRKMAGKPAQAAFWVGNLTMTTSNFFFSRKLYDVVGPFSALRYMHDWDWALRAQEHVDVMRLDLPLVRYRVHGANTISERKPWKHVAENAYLFASALSRRPLPRWASSAGLSSVDVMRILTENKSFAPLPVLFLLSQNLTPDALLRMLEDGEIEQQMERVLGNDAADLELMGSVEQLRRRLVLARDPLSPALLWHKLKKRGARYRRKLRARFSR